MKTVCIIPARMGSSRFFGKPLARLLGHTMIEHVYRRARLAKNIDEIYVATCDHEIAQKVKEFGGLCIMTSDKHMRGTDRVAEAAQLIEADIILNVQGDEPVVDPVSLDAAIMKMKENKDIGCINLTSLITEWDVFIDTNVVKAVQDENNNILYFSRQPIPTCHQCDFKQAIKQIGIYLFRKDVLLHFYEWGQTPLERAEAVDMMRFLEKGHNIRAVRCKDMISVDTPEELLRVEEILRRDPVCNEIFKMQDSEG